MLQMFDMAQAKGAWVTINDEIIGEVKEKLNLELKKQHQGVDNLRKYFEENKMPSLIWFSPPCTEYSCLNNAMPNKKPNIELANKIVMKGLEIIKYCNCKFILENPQTGTLKEQYFMKDLEFTDVDYCRYGFPYKKRTRLWNNLNFSGKLCFGKKDCNYMEKGKHLYSIGNSSYATNVREVNTNKSRLGQRYSIPNPLIEEIFLVANILY